MEENNKDNASEVDFFTKFMFGDKLTYERDDSYNKRKKENEWLFGQKEQRKEQNKNTSSTLNKLGELLENVDYIELMEHVDTLMTSASELKPLFRKLKPLLESFTEKK